MCVGQQLVVSVARGRQLQQRLQKPMDMRRGEQIDAARHQRHPLQRVIDRDREMIAGRHLLARQHDIAKRGGIRRDAPSILLP